MGVSIANSTPFTQVTVRLLGPAILLTHLGLLELVIRLPADD